MIIDEMNLLKYYNKTTDHICPICGEMVDRLHVTLDESVFVSTKRKSNLWMHKKCVTSQYDYVLGETHKE